MELSFVGGGVICLVGHCHSEIKKSYRQNGEDVWEEKCNIHLCTDDCADIDQLVVLDANTSAPSSALHRSGGSTRGEQLDGSLHSTHQCSHQSCHLYLAHLG